MEARSRKVVESSRNQERERKAVPRRLEADWSEMAGFLAGKISRQFKDQERLEQA